MNKIRPSNLMLLLNGYLSRRGSLSGPENNPTMHCRTLPIFITLDFIAFINPTNSLYSAGLSFSLTCKAREFSENVSNPKQLDKCYQEMKQMSKSLIGFVNFKRKTAKYKLTKIIPGKPVPTIKPGTTCDTMGSLFNLISPETPKKSF